MAISCCPVPRLAMSAEVVMDGVPDNASATTAVPTNVLTDVAGVNTASCRPVAVPARMDVLLLGVADNANGTITVPTIVLLLLAATVLRSCREVSVPLSTDVTVLRVVVTSCLIMLRPDSNEFAVDTNATSS